MKTITYVGTADIRRFTEDDPTGALEFLHHMPLEVSEKNAKLLLEDPRFAGEFIEGEIATPEPDVTPDVTIDDSGSPLPGL